MTKAKATCTECDHEWSPMKEPAEIDTPRCSQCGALGDSIEFEGVALEDDESAGPSIVERARRQGQKAELIGEIESLLGDLEELAPPGKEMPGEFRTQHVTLTTLRDGLEESERVSERELGELEGELKTIRGAVENHDVTERLEKTIAEKKERIDELYEREANLERKIEELEAEVERRERERQEKVQAVKMLAGVLD